MECRSRSWAESQIATVAQKMLADEVGIVEGSRRLVQLVGSLGESEDHLFAPIIVVESETEDLPVGDTRSLWSPAALEVKQKEVDAYLDQVRDVVLNVCRDLVIRYCGGKKL